MQENTAVLNKQSKRRTVYVVYGKETEEIREIRDFLRKRGLRLLRKEDGVKPNGEVTPFIGDAINNAFELAQAVIVLLTEDEKVQLCKDFQDADDEEFEKIFYAQPTQEQIFEAGYAFGASPKRTILVQIGQVRPFSDIVGRYVLHFTGTEEDYTLLRARLKLAGCFSRTGSETAIVSSNADIRKAADPGKVFVVHGRNTAARREMFAFLRSLDLTPIEWGQAVRLTEMGSPYTGEAVVAGIDEAQAVVVLLTGDDLVQLQQSSTEGKLPQARPNVLFEAGIAFNKYAKGTILVQVGSVRPCRDIQGRSMIKLTNKPASRWELMKRLHHVGCPVNFSGDWERRGDFDIVSCSEL